MININTITSLRKLFSKYFPSFTFSSSKPGAFIFYSTFPTLIPRRHILIKRSESLIDFLQQFWLLFQKSHHGQMISRQLDTRAQCLTWGSMQLQCFGLESVHLLVHLESASMTLLRVSHSYFSSSYYVLDNTATTLLCSSIILNKLITLERSGRRACPIYYLPLPDPGTTQWNHFKFPICPQFVTFQSKYINP